MTEYIYVVGTADGPIKIGISQNPTARLASFNTSAPFAVSLLWASEVESNSRMLEQTVHFAFRARRTSGEWFNATAAEGIREIVRAAETLRLSLVDVSESLIANRYRRRSVRPLTDEEEAEIQKMIASDPDNPEATDEQLANMKPFREVFPDLAKAIDQEIAKRGRPPKDVTKKPVTLRLDPDVIDKFKATGKGWQGRMNEALRQAKV